MNNNNNHHHFHHDHGGHDHNTGHTAKNLVCDKHTCVFCGECQHVCHAKAITVDTEKRLWSYDTALCYGCGACIKKCSVNAITEVTAE
jgi:MinD superfamily P-loop ATPase